MWRARGCIKPGSRSNLLGNQLVLIAPKDSKVSLELKPGADLAKALGGGRLAMGLVNSVPAGKYGKAALEKLGLWASVANSLAQAENVRAALLLVSRGEAALGVVYRTDAASDPSVKIIATFPPIRIYRSSIPLRLPRRRGRPRRPSLIILSLQRPRPSLKRKALRCWRRSDLERLAGSQSR